MDVLECSKIDVDNDSNIDRSMDNRSLFIANRFLSPTFDSAICPISSSARENIATEPTPTSSLNIFEDQNSAIENFVRYTENADLRNPTARFLTLNRGDDIQDSSISFINLIKSKYDFQVAFTVRVSEFFTQSVLSCSIDRKFDLMVWI